LKRFFRIYILGVIAVLLASVFTIYSFNNISHVSGEETNSTLEKDQGDDLDNVRDGVLLLLLTFLIIISLIIIFKDYLPLAFEI
jgi:hypothetical protein